MIFDYKEVDSMTIFKWKRREAWLSYFDLLVSAHARTMPLLEDQYYDMLLYVHIDEVPSTLTVEIYK